MWDKERPILGRREGTALHALVHLTQQHQWTQQNLWREWVVGLWALRAWFWELTHVRMKILDAVGEQVQHAMAANQGQNQSRR